jgi:hypothetical protein
MHDNQMQAHLAYIAGVMDSDGCFMITRQKRETKRLTEHYPTNVNQWSWSYMGSAKVHQIQPEAVNFIKDVTGMGTITLHGARPSRPNSMPIYQWGIRKREHVIKFLQMIMPYLKIKKNRAEFLLEYCLNISKNPPVSYQGLSKEELDYREESYRKMRKLNDNKAAATTEPQNRESECYSLISDSKDGEGRLKCHPRLEIGQ